MAVAEDRLRKIGMLSMVKNVQTINMSKGLGPNDSAAVVLVLDSSPSNELMQGWNNRNRNYSSGLVPDLANIAYAVSAAFDDDGIIPSTYFNERVSNIGLGDVNIDDSLGLIERTYRQNWAGGTNYLAALKWIVSQVDAFAGIDLGYSGAPMSVKFQSDLPLFAIFITDGEPTDSKSAIIDYIKRISQLPIFIQFVGVGVDNDFHFLNKQLNEMPEGSRLIDNCGFFNAMEVMPPGSYGPGVKRTAEQQDRLQKLILSKLLNEFPAYYREARRIGLLTPQ
ncbi:MAG: VWA domain-containing protein [Candidatus Saccharimonas sp.]